jgi:hypothetical protein
VKCESVFIQCVNTIRMVRFNVALGQDVDEEYDDYCLSVGCPQRGSVKMKKMSWDDDDCRLQRAAA